MSVLDFLKRAVSRCMSTPPVTPATVAVEDYYYPPCAYELIDLMDQYVNEERKAYGQTRPVTKEEMLFYHNVVATLHEDTVIALVRGMKEHKKFDALLALRNFSSNDYWDETRLKDEAFFYGVMSDRRSGWYYFSEALDRLRKAEPEFASCDFSALNESSRQHALALFRVILHFVEYKGATSPDTSSFLREHPEMADRVIAFIENRGIGIGSFDTEVFTMAKEAGVQVLDIGVL